MTELLVLALRATSGRHAEAARDVLLTVIFLQVLAASDHAGPPHVSSRAPRRMFAPRPRMSARSSLTGRRPRG
ncbi:hypothetical protein DVA67_020770 [Solirubrobacter sp. CPCC 204708]|uniref:Uncharacterized protein n=1 Tax=Solirubrobacter deserti TaxID=2282478 RepID=A0ABT4RT89_9ACTN|nr:hypothetical protein [Solirubrobacter deserti]MBE2318427.1 hypothetical protein [Solirubrobacter deserti]MDA0141799.1 hypothetical protein [Solirubrobacter deserti]